MKSLISKITLFTLLISSSLSLQATILDADFGGTTGGLTRDTNTNLEWLDSTFTRGQSVAAVDARLQSGGDLFGFRFASRGEVHRLLSDFGLPTLAFPDATTPTVEFNVIDAFDATGYALYINAFNAVLDKIGATVFMSARQTNNTVEGSVINTPAEKAVAGWDISQIRVDVQYNSIFHSSLPGASGLSYRSSVFGGTFADAIPDTFVWLVRDSSATGTVPEPLTITLLLLGLTGLGFSRRSQLALRRME